jgi:hypothetical protein
VLKHGRLARRDGMVPEERFAAGTFCKDLLGANAEPAGLRSPQHRGLLFIRLNFVAF